MYGFITMVMEGSPCILNTNAHDMLILTPLRPFISWKWPIVGFYPYVDTTQGVSAITRQPLADVSVPEGGCVSGNEAIRYAGATSWALRWFSLEEERVMQQSSVSISLKFWEPRYQSSRRPRTSPSHLHKQINPRNQRDKGLSIPTRSLTGVRSDRYDKIIFLVFLW